jgi:hypothetical protein
MKDLGTWRLKQWCDMRVKGGREIQILLKMQRKVMKDLIRRSL